jgi:hypothetical protein
MHTPKANPLTELLASKFGFLRVRLWSMIQQREIEKLKNYKMALHLVVLVAIAVTIAKEKKNASTKAFKISQDA